MGLLGTCVHLSESPTQVRSETWGEVFTLHKI